jgi:hypothetical protein
MLVEVKFYAFGTGFLQRTFAFGYSVHGALLSRFNGVLLTPFAFAFHA